MVCIVGAANFLSAPKQASGFTCAYHCMLAEAALISFLRTGRGVTYMDFDDNFLDFSIKCFGYHGDSEALSLRADLCLLVEQLSLSQAKLSGNSDVDDNELDSVIVAVSHKKDKKTQKKKPLVRADTTRKKKEAQQKRNPSKVHDRQSDLRSKVHQDRQKEAQKEGDNLFAGKLAHGVEPSLSFGARKTYERVTGQHAASITQGKNNQSRRAMYQFIQSEKSCAKMMSYGSDELNEHCARTKIVGFIFDQVVPRPDLHGFDINKRRESPCRLGIGLSKEDALFLAKDIVANFKKYHFTDSPIEVDAIVFGSDRERLDKVLKIGKKDARVLDKEENAELLKDVTAIAKTPLKSAVSQGGTVVQDW